MTELKREYVVPLRRKTRFAPKWRRSKKAVSVLKEFIQKHMKTEDVIICSELNEHIWGRGAKNPPGKVSVTALRKDIGGEFRTLVNLSQFGIDEQSKLYNTVPVAAPSTQAAESLDEDLGDDKSEEVKDAEVTEKEVPKEEAKVEEKKTEAKVEEKKEVKKDE